MNTDEIHKKYSINAGIFFTILLGVVPLFLTFISKALKIDRTYEYLLIGLFLFLTWIVTLNFFKSYSSKLFEEACANLNGTTEKIHSALYDIFVSSFHQWIFNDSELNKHYESKIQKGKAILVITPTFRNDYNQGDNSTSTDFFNNVVNNLKRGIKYVYITHKPVAVKHFDKLIAFHMKKSDIKPRDIWLLVTTIPLVTEMVYYPLDPPSAFFIINTDIEKLYEKGAEGHVKLVETKKNSEFNVKMVKDQDFDRLEDYIKYIFQHSETEVWDFDSNGMKKDHKVNNDDIREFKSLTGIYIL
ncbi:hypothetical protein [Candidatus Magnetomonas plexicatena]|uniref:hypothetical protein n=1 Tax=Candidatus Magnetomonas plexicatena TaxID=2552947 RepID=UPI001C75F37A|nr:hypothetical protein E2O03_014810 [Nitrospirales bacterium LBB_01]